MKLTYRGAHYDYSPHTIGTVPRETVANAIKPTFSLNYRGAVYSVDPNAVSHEPVWQPIAQLTYRGVAYALNGWNQPVVATRTSQLPHWKPSLRTETINTHRDSLDRNLQHRLQVAREKGDQNLINLLEREQQQLA